jgi:hypothetical protein
VSFGITAALGAMMGKKFAAGASLVPSGVIAVGAAACACSTSATSCGEGTRRTKRKRRKMSDTDEFFFS